MANYYLPQNDPNSALRSAGLKAMQTFYRYETHLGIPLSNFPDAVRDTDGPDWIRQVLEISARDRVNMSTYMNSTPFKFMNAYPPNITNLAFIKFVLGSITTSGGSILQAFINTGSNIFDFVLPDMGPGGPVTSTQQFMDLFHSIDLPEVANRFETDDSFTNNFVAGPNPEQLQRMTQIPNNFPISNAQFQSLPQFQSDDLNTAISQGRVFYLDRTDMASWKNGSHYGVATKYTFAPMCAFALPVGSSKLYAFAIKCNPTSQMIFNPTQDNAWKMAKNCVLVAHNQHHELISHLGLTHYLIEPLLVSMRRQLSTSHPVYALLNHHFEGTMLINYGATHNLILPTRSVDRLFGGDLNSAFPYMVQQRLAYNFTENYLPTRLAAQGTDQTSALSYFPYRDDALLVWNAIYSWMSDFVSLFYQSEADVAADTELQAWAAEVASPTGGAVAGFGGTMPGFISSRQDLINTLTMTIFTAGPQHAAVNFAQGSDMMFVAANPMLAMQPEPTRLDYTRQDWLNHLPGIETGITAINILAILSGVHYTTLGNYYNDPNALLSDFSSGPVNSLVQKFQANLQAVEQQINAANATRFTPYVHLLPSRIPQGVNI